MTLPWSLNLAPHCPIRAGVYTGSQGRKSRPHTTTPKLRNHLLLKSCLGRYPASTSARDPAPSRILQTSRDPRSPKTPAHRPHLQAPPAAIHYSAPRRREGAEEVGRSTAGSGRGSREGLPEGWGTGLLNPSQARGKHVAVANGARRAALRIRSSALGVASLL